MAVVQNRESYRFYTPTSKPQAPKKPQPLVQIGKDITGTGATLLLDYDNAILNQWLAEKWLDWTINDYYIPSGVFAGEVAAKEFSFIMGAWEWINDNIDYDTAALDLRWRDRKASDVLDRGFGVCADFNILLITMLRSAGIEARYVEGDKILNNFDYHAWTQIRIGGVWYNVDPLLDASADFVLDEFKSTFDDYTTAILGSDTNTWDPFYGDDVKQFFDAL